MSSSSKIVTRRRCDNRGVLVRSMAGEVGVGRAGEYYMAVGEVMEKWVFLSAKALGVKRLASELVSESSMPYRQVTRGVSMASKYSWWCVA